MKTYLFILIQLCFISFVFSQEAKTYVIVHGAWGGSWQFKNTAQKLEDAGNKVYRVNLTGLGERYHLASPEINLTTHIKDVINTILFEKLENIILVGHSYGGMVITGVADSLPERIQKTVYLDALVPENGESVSQFRLSPPANNNSSGEKPSGSGEQTAPPAYIIPVWVKDTTTFPRDVPHPIACFVEKISLKNEKRKSIPSTYIFTFEGDKTKDTFYTFAERAKGYNWKVVEMEADHNPQIKKLDELVGILLNEI